MAYMSQNYVGFRRVTITADWVRGEQPHVEVEGSDTISTCLFLSSDAFVEFEDAVRALRPRRLASTDIFFTDLDG